MRATVLRVAGGLALASGGAALLRGGPTASLADLPAFGAVLLALLPLAGNNAALALALPGLGAALAEGTGACLLALAYAQAAAALGRMGRQPATRDLVTAGLALGTLPFLHPAGAALDFAVLPAIAASLPAALVSGRGLMATLLILGFPGLAFAAAYGLLASRFGQAPGAPFLTLAGLGQGFDAREATACLAGALPAIVWLCGPLPWRRPDPALVAVPLAAGLLQGLGGGRVELAAVLAPALLAAARQPAPAPQVRWFGATLALTGVVGAHWIRLPWTSS
ncbi:hypothetical protein [Zavarzinia sp.]|uniref:hypothetical protein n=1 Tax=Zavarzinia sp. TaxID=2027920 RepID=UPI0035697F6C